MLDAKQVFIEALERNPADDLEQFLNEACAGDATLRARVEDLLRAHREAGSFLGGAWPSSITSQEDLGAAPGVMIGPYKLLEQIGEGGFGVVFLAEQQQPVRRKVALKIIKPGMDTREVIARFEAERQALAIMDHPNIARVLDAGATDAGRPFFVMELVRGVAITDYCDQNSLTPRQRLELFLPVCHAIQHAHQKGIIHRDIKPSNVLVASHDGRPVVKVIDFGVAKAMGGQLGDHTVYTRFTQMVGTPLYMSPEQAELSGLDIDTRTDIYSLGVLLYELLTGATPFDRRRLSKAALDEIRRIIREEEPPKPSTRLSDSGDSLPAIAANRHMEPSRLTKLVRGDLDWIVMKALEKDRQRRYESANGLASDVQRYLADEPVEACPPSTSYRLAKFARKNRKAIAILAGFAAIFVMGAVVSAWQAIRATQALSDTKQALVETAESRRLAENVTNYLIDAFAKPDPEQDGRDVKVIDVLDGAVVKLEADFRDAPLIKAKLFEVLGKTYLGLGIPQKSQELYEKARAILLSEFGSDHVATILCENDLAVAYRVQGRLQDCIAILEENYPLLIAQSGATDLDALRCASDLADAYRADARYRQAIELGELVLKERRKQLGSDDHLTLLSMSNLAETYFAAGLRDESLRLSEESLKRRQTAAEQNAPAALAAMNNLAQTYAAEGRLQEAKELAVAALEQARGIHEPGDIHMMLLMGNLSTIYTRTREFDKAIPLAIEVLDLKQKHRGPFHPSTLISMNNLAMAYREAGESQKALPLFKESLELTRQHVGRDSPQAITSVNNLALVYADLGEWEDSAKLFREALELCQRVLPPEHIDTLATMSSLADVLRELRQYDEAAQYAEAALASLRDQVPPGHPQWIASTGNLAGIYLEQGHLDKATPWFREAVDAKKLAAGEGSDEVAKMLTDIAKHLCNAKHCAEGEKYLRESLVIRQANHPDDWRTFSAQAQLGEAILAQEEFVEAERELIPAHEGMLARIDSIPPEEHGRLRESAEMIVRLYAAWGKPETAAEWRRKLEELK